MERDLNIKKLFICFTLFLMLMLPSTALASDWSGSMKDVFNTGVTGDVTPVSSPDGNSWAFKMMDMGMNTMPVIVDGVVYTVSSNGFSAVELESGKELWNVSESVGYALSNPVYGDGVVFAGSGSGKLYALNTVSRSSWNIDVSRNMINAPILYEAHRLYFGDTKDWAGNDGSFYCFSDNGSSTPVWSRPASNGRGYYKVGAALIGDYLVYGDNGGNLSSVNKFDGSTVDEVNLNELFNKDIGGIWAGVTYDAESKRLYTSSSNSTGGGYCLFLGFDPASGTFSESVKEAKAIASSTSTPAIYGDRVYVGTGGIFSSAPDRLLCLDRTNLDKIWEYAPDGAVQSSPSISTYYDDGDGEVYIYFTTNSDTGSLYCLQDNATGTAPVEKFVYDGGHPNFALGDAALSNGWAVFGNNGGYLIGATTAEALEGANSSQTGKPTVLRDVELTLSSGTFSYVPAANKSASYNWDRLTDLGALEATGLDFETGDLSGGSFWITSVGGIENEPWGDPGAKSWAIFINGKSSSMGLGGTSLKAGDTVTFYYLPWDQTTFEPLVKEAAYIVNIRVDVETEGWTQFHKDAAHTGFAYGDAPDTNNLLWVSDPIWATPSSSPVIAEGKVFVKCGADNFLSLMPAFIEDNRIVVLDKFTGKTLSDYSGGDIEGSWSSPCYYNGEVWLGRSTKGIGGATVAAGKVFDSSDMEHRYYCTDIKTDEERWNFTVSGSIRGTATYSNGKVYLTSGDLFSSPGYVYCVDAESGDELWTQTVSYQPAGSPAVSEGVVYLTVYSGELYALDAEDGSVLWKETIPTTDVSSTPAIAYGNVYISGGCPGYSTIETYCFNATTHELVWNTSDDEEIGGWTTSVAVADNKVFVGKHAEGDLFGHNTTCALDAHTGNVIWEAPCGGSSPAVSDEIVFTIGADGRVYAFADPDSEPSLEIIFNDTVNLEEGKFSYSPAANPSAKYEWNRMTDLGALIATGIEFETEDLNYGSFWTTSLNGIENQDYSLPGARLWSIFINGESAPSGLGGNALSGGDRVSFYYCPWEGMTPLTDQATYAVHITVKAVPFDDWSQFHKDAAHTGFSSGDAPDTNSLLWVSDPIGAVTSSSPVIASGKVFVNCGGGSCCCDKDTETSSEGAKIVALDEFTGDSLFTCGNGSDRYGSWASPCYNEGKIRCGLPESVNGGTMVANGKVYVGNYDGHKYLCFDEETGEELWAFEVAGNAQSTPAFSDGKVFLTSGTFSDGENPGNGYVYCVYANSGAEKWNVSLPKSAFGSPAVSKGVVYVTSFLFGSGEGKGNLYALYAENGTEVWNEPAVIQATDSTPAIAYGNVYVAAGCPGSNPVQTYCFNSTTGTPVWNTSVEDDIGGWTVSVAVADHKVFVGKCNEGDMYGHYGLHALNATTGKSVWNSPYGGSSPAITDGIVFTIGADGRVYAFADPAELDIDYSIPDTGLSLDAKVLPAVSIKLNNTDLDFGTLSLDESRSVHLSITNAGKSDVSVSAGLGEGSSTLYKNHLFFGPSLWNQYSKLISSQSTEDVEVVLNPAGYGGDLGEAEGKLIFWVEAV